MKINSKSSYYIIVIATGIITFLISGLTLLPHNQAPYQATIQKVLIAYGGLLNKTKNNIEHEPLKDKLFPLELTFINTTTKKFEIKYEIEDNILSISNYYSLSREEQEAFDKIISLICLEKNSSQLTNEIFEGEIDKHKAYKHLNIYFLLNEKEQPSSYRKYYKTIVNYFNQYFKKKEVKLMIKYIFYDSVKGINDNSDFYSTIKEKNSNILFEELNDEDNLNIIFYNKTGLTNIHPEFNRDLNSFIYGLDLEKHLTDNLLNTIISYNVLNTFFPIKYLNHDIFTNENLKQIIQIFNLRKVQYHLLLISTLRNLEKLSKIFPVYESILTIDAVKNTVRIIK